MSSYDVSTSTSDDERKQYSSSAESVAGFGAAALAPGEPSALATRCDAGGKMAVK